jgi:hypothetical protein
MAAKGETIRVMNPELKQNDKPKKPTANGDNLHRADAGSEQPAAAPSSVDGDAQVEGANQSTLAAPIASGTAAMPQALLSSGKFLPPD